MILCSRKGVKAAGKSDRRQVGRRHEQADDMKKLEEKWGGGRHMKGKGMRRRKVRHVDGGEAWREERMEKYRDESGETVLYGRGTKRETV